MRFIAQILVKNMQTPRILLDCDGVIADFLTSALKVLNGKLGLEGSARFNESHIVQWDICKSIGKPEMWKDINEAASQKGFCTNILPYDHAKEGVKKIQSLGKVYVVTSPLSTPHWVFERGEWLKEHFGIEKPNVVHTEAKHIIVGDFLIDDKLDNILAWAAHHPTSLGLLWDAPYNQSEPIPGVKRVFNWDDVSAAITEHLSKKR